MSVKIELKCNRCLWENDHKPHWECSCHQVWNGLDTEGLCPSCKTVWTKLQCPKCAFPLLLEEWYKLPVLGYQGNHKRRKGQSGNPEFLHVFLGEDGMKKSLYDQVIENAHWWIMSKKRYLYKHPEADLIWFNLCIYEPELIRLIDKGMHQIQNNKGFDINHPLVDLDVPGFNRLMDILMVDRINRFAHFEFVSKGYVIDEFDIKGEADELIKMFNQVMTVENTG